MTATGTFSLDTTTYLSANQTITLSGAVTGSGTTAITTTIATPGTLTVSSANTTVTAHTHAITSSSAPGATASILATDASGILGTTGTRIVKGWFTDITVTNAIAGSVTGNAGTVTNGVYTSGAGIVYLTPTGSAALLTSFPTFNQNTSGNAASLSAILVSTLGGSGINNAGTLT